MVLNLLDNNLEKENFGILYIVSTPIGNMEDITLRSLRVLKEVDIIAAEDTRNTGRLLSHYGINGNLISCHDHNEENRSNDLIYKLKQGKTIALVSDAGTPSVSDPGYKLVEKVVKEDIKVIPVPGVSAVITALSASGLPTDSFIFIGFPPKKRNKRLDQLKELSKEPRTLVFYNSPKRIVPFVLEAKEIMGERYAVLAREMTKNYEEFIRGDLSQIAKELENRPSVKGECTLLISSVRSETSSLSIEELRGAIERELLVNKKKISVFARDFAKNIISQRVLYTRKY